MKKAQSRAAILKKMMGGRPGAYLFGKRVVGLSADEVRKNVRYGVDPAREDSWPLGYVETNPLAKAVVESTTRATKEAN